MTDKTNDILGLMGETAESAAPAMPSLNLNLSLSDEDLETGPSYVHIPPGTKTNFEVYQVDASFVVNKNTGAQELKWKVTFKAVEDTWGPGKMVTDFILFRQSMAWKWGPFLKAVGLVDGGGAVDNKVFENPAQIEGKVVHAQVLGYSWKGDGLPRSYGKNKKPVPMDGTRYYEDLGNYKPAGPKSAESEDKAEELDGLAEFSTEDYL